MQFCLALWFFGGMGHAAALGPKTSMGEWADRRVDREIVLPKGWVEVSLGAETKLSGSYWDGQGEERAWDDQVRWSYSQAWLKLEQGFSAHLKPYLHIPVVMSGVYRDGTPLVRTSALGDVHSGLVFQPWLARRQKVAIQVDLKSPTGVEWPGESIGGGANVQNFLTGTGTTNLGAFVLGHALLGDITRLEARVGGVLKFPGIVGYVLEEGGFGNGWLDPGDELLGELNLVFQPTDKLSASVGSTYSVRTSYWMGTSGESLWGASWEWLADGGSFLDGELGLTWDFGSRWSLEGCVGRSIRGSDSRPFAALGLEEFSPQPGITGALGVVGRW